MCGIIGIISRQDVVSSLVNSLKRLEYRGYDSAGVAVVNSSNDIERVRAKGKIVNLEEELVQNPINGLIGIGHTRWATHGMPSTTNAHPHQIGKVSVVHNGIIENYRLLKAELISKGHVFNTDTDTEVVPHLVTFYLEQRHNIRQAVKLAIDRLEGAFSLAILYADDPNLMIGARRGSPLVIGYGDGANYIGSDAYALAELTDKFAYLEEDDIAFVSINKVEIYNKDQQIDRLIKRIELSKNNNGKENYAHYMQKEIYEQPSVISDTLNAYLDLTNLTLNFGGVDIDFNKVPKITIVACGTSYYAGLVAKYWFENIAHTTIEIDIASEFRYRNIMLPEGGIALFISQSGETADTLAALKFAKSQKQIICSIVNVPESSIARESDIVLPIYAGYEIGVASTKAFTAQLTLLACFALLVAESKKVLLRNQLAELIGMLAEVPGKVARVLTQDDKIKTIAENIVRANTVLYIGRGTSYAIALEGALKLKELSYIHAEGIAAGELKHGPIALIDENVPVIAIAPHDHLFEKTASNIHEIIARQAQVVVISDKLGLTHLTDVGVEQLEMLDTHPLFAPILYSIPLQLLAYHVAVLKGNDVDQPRNLAKSVTVE
jgi:glucosamine--fructose-6-phosphate aminotransferase (isomerizing)